MHRYEIFNLATRSKGAKVVLPPVSARIGTEKAYVAALRSLLNGMAAEVKGSVIEAYRSDLALRNAPRSFTGDARTEWFARLKVVTAQLVRVAGDTVNRILQLESQRHTKEFMATAQRALSIDISAVVGQEDLAEYLRTATDRNASLISSLADDLVKRVEQATYENYVAGNSVKTLRDRLQKQFAIGENRARLIARDQTAKLNSDMNRIRQLQAGVTSYSWMTSHDERVRGTPGGKYPNARPSHYALDGKEFSWNAGPPSTGGQHPGQPIQCRCVARGIVEF